MQIYRLWRSHHPKTRSTWDRTVLGTTNLGTPIKCGKIQNHHKVSNTGKKELISIDILRVATPDNVSHPRETIYEGDFGKSTASNERDQRIRIEKLKNAWLNKSQRIEDSGILCGHRPLEICDSKTESLTYLSLCSEARQIFGSQVPTEHLTNFQEKKSGAVLIMYSLNNYI